MLREGWRVGVGGGDPNGFKSVTAFYPDQNTSSNGNFRFIVKFQSKNWVLVWMIKSFITLFKWSSEHYNNWYWSGFHKDGIIWQSWRVCRDTGESNLSQNCAIFCYANSKFVHSNFQTGEWIGQELAKTTWSSSQTHQF